MGYEYSGDSPSDYDNELSDAEREGQKPWERTCIRTIREEIEWENQYPLHAMVKDVNRDGTDLLIRPEDLDREEIMALFKAGRRLEERVEGYSVLDYVESNRAVKAALCRIFEEFEEFEILGVMQSGNSPSKVLRI